MHSADMPSPKKSRFVDEICERYGEIEYRSGKVVMGGVVQAVTFAYLICLSVRPSVCHTPVLCRNG